MWRSSKFEVSLLRGEPKKQVDELGAFDCFVGKAESLKRSSLIRVRHGERVPFFGKREWVFSWLGKPTFTKFKPRRSDVRPNGVVESRQETHDNLGNSNVGQKGLDGFNGFSFRFGRVGGEQDFEQTQIGVACCRWCVASGTTVSEGVVQWGGTQSAATEPGVRVDAPAQENGNAGGLRNARSNALKTVPQGGKTLRSETERRSRSER